MILDNDPQLELTVDSIPTPPEEQTASPPASSLVESNDRIFVATNWMNLNYLYEGGILYPPATYRKWYSDASFETAPDRLLAIRQPVNTELIEIALASIRQKYPVLIEVDSQAFSERGFAALTRLNQSKPLTLASVEAIVWMLDRPLHLDQVRRVVWCSDTDRTEFEVRLPQSNTPNGRTLDTTVEPELFIGPEEVGLSQIRKWSDGLPSLPSNHLDLFHKGDRIGGALTGMFASANHSTEELNRLIDLLNNRHKPAKRAKAGTPFFPLLSGQKRSSKSDPDVVLVQILSELLPEIDTWEMTSSDVLGRLRATIIDQPQYSRVQKRINEYLDRIEDVLNLERAFEQFHAGTTGLISGNALLVLLVRLWEPDRLSELDFDGLNAEPYVSLMVGYLFGLLHGRRLLPASIRP